MSRVKNLIYSILVAPRRRYDPRAFGDAYFSSAASEPDVARARRYIEFFRPGSVVDVGCGTGNLVWGFRRSGVEARGIELSPDAIRQSAKEVRPFLQLGDVLDTGLPDESFDLVTCIDVLEHIPPPDSDQAIGELHRIARRHVLLHVCLWSEGNASRDPTHVNLRSRRYWTGKLRRRGYELIEVPPDFPCGHNAFIVKKEA